MKNAPRHFCYTDHPSKNYGLNSLAFEDGRGNTFYFSYDTLVAFDSVKLGRVVCLKNYWNVTTGKHLNAIESDKSKRVDQATFDQLYAEAFVQ